jgi:hypothetical protein
MIGRETYKGVGFAKVFRSSPLTLRSGARYSFANISGDIEMLPLVVMCFITPSLVRLSAMSKVMVPAKSPLLWLDTSFSCGFRSVGSLCDAMMRT